MENTRTRTTPRVFIARLVGTTIFDPLGDAVGKVHDVVVLIQLRGEPRWAWSSRCPGGDACSFRYHG